MPRPEWVRLVPARRNEEQRDGVYGGHLGGGWCERANTLRIGLSRDIISAFAG